MSKLTELWNNLQASERRVIVLGSIFVVAIMFYFYIWEPWHKAIVHYKTAVPQKRADLQWIKAQADLAARIQGTANPAEDTGSRKPLLTIVEQTAQKQGLRKKIKQMTPGDKSNEVKVWLSEVSFDKWLYWVEQLKNTEAIEVKTVNIQKSDQGIVEIRATYSRI